MVSRQTLVVTAFVLAALPAAYLVEAASGQFTLSFLALLAVGVGAPSLVNDYLDRHESDGNGV
ncbi:hypothetical protein C5B91_03470 [Haloferax sp. Atlit-10N]|uniref:1,4-dihydroxy-2-naphthoate octaprenyltransferase n=1 Tax=Haloferax prahovense (strain DSM 18310 / JCM 13924 / TL6) TaxID=1227461 RepID=M0GMA0_HALPT|nr:MULTISPECIES: hypothetical protein [Haloferax]ELZ73330.1 hypothetical protein C457_05206 [Haloferax prahovense DSM 18310]RDZ45990.1 hypothetical protein C5B86_09645 [Haloferax sp. Atlit-19N]RDZ46738.1 hypothetical protein C5B87_03470 [Haloferax sp. Atlit-16N]RDZ60570.1 hypothetical protein C5B91_03470 [Haloferax sp. Atlit-10N]